MEGSWVRAAEARAVLIAGPTASGKSALALRLAESEVRAGRNPVIVNADSMQIYDGLRILTARPFEAGMGGIEHRLYGYVPPEERYSVGRWLEDAAAVLEACANAGSLPIVTGGTGLYFKALTEGIAGTPPIPEALRAELSGFLDAAGPAALHERLARRDSQAAATIGPGDTQRTLRALEVVEATGRPLADWQSRQEGRGMLAGGGVERLVLEPERALLYERIDRRFDAMVGGGALDEVRALLDRRLDPRLPAMKAIGIRAFAGFLRNELTLDEAVARAKTETRRYAKRQTTWFRNQMADWPRAAA